MSQQRVLTIKSSPFQLELSTNFPGPKRRFYIFIKNPESRDDEFSIILDNTFNFRISERITTNSRDILYKCGYLRYFFQIRGHVRVTFRNFRINWNTFIASNQPAFALYDIL